MIETIRERSQGSPARLRDPETALRELDVLTRSHPQDNGLKLAFAWALVSFGKLDRSVEYLESLEGEVHDRDNQAWILTLLGRAYSRNGDGVSAWNAYEAAHSIRPGAITAYNLGVLLIRQGRYADALQYFDESDVQLGNQSDNLYAIGYCANRLGEWDRAVAALRRSLDQGHQEEVVHTELAFALFHLEQYGAAQVEAKAALRRVKSPSRKAWLLVMIAVTHQALGLAGPARHYYRRAIKFEPNNVDAQFNLGVILLEHGRYSEAVTHLQRASDLDSSSEVRLALGQASMEAGDLRRAADILGNMTDDPVVGDRALFLYVDTLANLGDYASLLTVADTKLQRGNASAIAWAAVARALRLGGRLSEAAVALQRAMSMAPDDGWVTLETLAQEGAT